MAFAEASFEVRPVTAAQADAVRADILLYVRGPKDAEALLQSVLQADPKNAPAHETMGRVKVRENDFAAAKKWYGEAVQLDSQSYLAQYNFAAMSLRDRDKDEDSAIAQSLRAAIKLNPKFAPAYDTLAQFYAMRHERYDEAHESEQCCGWTGAAEYSLSFERCAGAAGESEAGRTRSAY